MEILILKSGEMTNRKNYLYITNHYNDRIIFSCNPAVDCKTVWISFILVFGWMLKFMCDIFD